MFKKDNGLKELLDYVNRHEDFMNALKKLEDKFDKTAERLEGLLSQPSLAFLKQGVEDLHKLANELALQGSQIKADQNLWKDRLTQELKLMRAELVRDFRTIRLELDEVRTDSVRLNVP